MATKSEAERITILEVKVEDLSKNIETLTEVNKELVAALNKGKGILMSISFFVGSGFLAVLSYVAGWFK